MKTLLLTGFMPFLENNTNPTEKIVQELNEREIGGYKVIGKVLPVDFSESGKQLIAIYEQVKPDVVISLGLASGRHLITPERIAINCNDGEPDNNGVRLQDHRIQEDGPAGYFSTLPIRRFVETLKENELPAEISNTAGTYLCNNVMYNLLHHIDLCGTKVRSGFVHIPASFELSVINSRLPGWSHRDLIFAIERMIEVLDVD
ncbi:pyroglutamyl-peptidase I [Bacillaceae bacterium IKA-2]|nr:pyroglutamyl-peptidase I [Bacillaceae bacterium IKA-2]